MAISGVLFGWLAPFSEPCFPETLWSNSRNRGAGDVEYLDERPETDNCRIVQGVRVGAPERPPRAERFERGERTERPERSERPERTAAPSISELLREGQEIIVQIAKEPLGQKGARITSHIALPGRFLVYMPTVDHVGVSRKIPSDEERQRLKRILQTNRNGMTGGFIVPHRRRRQERRRAARRHALPL